MADDGERDDGPSCEFDVWVTGDGPTVNVTVAGEIDIASAPTLYLALNSVRTRGAASVVVDLRGVTFLDSTGLRVLLTANEDIDGRMRVVPSRACLRLFEIAGVADLFTDAEPPVGSRADR
jgi:anti-anti-sigma factor